MTTGDQSADYPEVRANSADELRDAVPRPRHLLDDNLSKEQIAILRRMTPEQRWQAAHRLYWTMRRHKTAFLRSQHPDWSEQQIDDEVRRLFSHART